MIEIAKSYEMEAFSPLWGISEEELIKEILQFEIIIKSLATDIGLNDLLGKRLNMDAITRLHEKGLMLSEDTSDLHTLAVDGPIFKHPLQYRIGELFEGEYYSKVDVHYLYSASSPKERTLMTEESRFVYKSTVGAKFMFIPRALISREM